MKLWLADRLRQWADRLDAPEYERPTSVSLEESDMDMRGPLHSIVELPEFGSSVSHYDDHLMDTTYL